VRVAVAGWTPADDAFGVEPGRGRVVDLTAAESDAPAPNAGVLTALNLSGRVRIAPAPR
jgi:hypothetical protein